MNYFELHIGDYEAATAHLSTLEDAAYGRMLRTYYRTEKPLPADVRQVFRLVRAQSKPERDAVQAVLEEFFELRDDGWHQDRCDAELRRYRDGEPEREQRKANEETRLKRHREERASLFKALNDRGRHAPWNTKIEELRRLAGALHEGQKEPPATKTATQPATAPATPATATHGNVSPPPNTQYPIPKEEGNTARKRASSHPPCPDGVADQVWADWLQLRKAKRAPVTETVLAGAADEARKAGLTLEAFLRVWCRRGTQGLEAAWLAPQERGRPAAVDTEPEWRREQRERNEAFLGPAAARRRTTTTIDMEAADAPAKLLG